MFIFLQLTFATTCNSSKFFNANELKVCGHPFVNHIEDVRDQLASVRTTQIQFKNLTNFTLDDFEDLCLDVCPMIAAHARITWELRASTGRFYKFIHQQRNLSFLIFLKYDNICFFRNHLKITSFFSPNFYILQYFLLFNELSLMLLQLYTNNVLLCVCISLIYFYNFFFAKIISQMIGNCNKMELDIMIFILFEHFLPHKTRYKSGNLLTTFTILGKMNVRGCY